MDVEGVVKGIKKKRLTSGLQPRQRLQYRWLSLLSAVAVAKGIQFTQLLTAGLADTYFNLLK